MIPVTRRKSSNPTLSPPRFEINPRINSRMWHFPLSSLSLSIYTEPAASFLIRLHREEAGRCLLLSKDSSTTSSLPGLAPPPPPLSAKLARRLLQSGRKERSPALVVPRFDLIGLPTFSWQNRSCLRLRRWKRPAFPLLPAVWRRFRPAGHPPPSPSSSSSSGRKTFARWRTIESTERFVRFLPIFWRFSRTLRGNWRPALLDGRGGGGWRLDCSRKPAGERADIARGVRPFSLTPWWGWIREIQENLGFLCQGDTLSEIGSVWLNVIGQNFYFELLGYELNFNPSRF